VQGTQRSHVVGIFRQVKTHSYVGLRLQVIGLIQLYILNDLGQITRATHIPVRQVQMNTVAVMRVTVNMVYPVGVERAGAPDQPMYLILF
jgi:hypothetical protein